jgi:rare lipoprotein A
MRLPADIFARRWALLLVLATELAGCASHETLASSGAGAGDVAATGPAADYPMVIGEPYRIGAALYTPADTMNYDEVGYAAADSGSGITGSHHTLPLPSYVEVTSLATGKTILVRLARRGPMNGDAVVGLSPAAFAQLGVSAGEPVRVRRVNPPEEERAALREGRAAPARMDTPPSLVAVLKRKLPGQGSATLAPIPPLAPKAVAAVAVPASSVALHDTTPVTARATAASARPAPESAPPPLPPLRTATAPGARSKQPQHPAVALPKPPGSRHGNYVVQAATMSTRDRAQKVASAIGGSVSAAGRYFRVQTGPFDSREQAQASLAKVRAAGYSDARISNRD